MTAGLLALAIGVGCIGPASAATFQFALDVPTAKGAKTRAFLWVPPDAAQVRGVLVAGMTLAERDLVQDPQVRAACAAERLAIVFLRSGLGAVDLDATLRALGQTSGYVELAVAPLFFAGHSAGGPQAKSAAAARADRCFGLMQYRGGAPSWEPPLPPGVPALMMVGQFDEFAKAPMRDEAGRECWENARDDLAKHRANADGLGSIVVEPGAGHFAWSERSAGHFALFLRKAAKARIPGWDPRTQTPVKCVPLDPAQGWLTDLALRSPTPLAPARASEYTGDRTKAAWHFDRELAEATVAYHRGLVGKKDQFLRWTEPVSVDAGARHFFLAIRWVGDGQTFEVAPAYATTIPKQHGGQGPKWLGAGGPASHGQAAIGVRAVGGPAVAVGERRFRIRHDALDPASEPGRITFLAFSVGDAEHRYTEQVGMLPRGFSGFAEGREQKLTFAPLGDPSRGPVPLRATSDAGLTVEHYVAYGPLAIEGGMLRLAELPSRARFPIEAQVVAYQFGRGVEPKVRTATPIVQTIRIERP